MQARTAQTGQATVEWVALIALIATLFLGLLALPMSLPGADLGQRLAARLICAVAGTGCADELEGAYGADTAELVRANLPGLAFGQQAALVPVDFRTCRDRECAAHPGGAEAGSSASGEPLTAFTRVIDCREPGSECDRDSEGRIYIQYWFYYPESSTFDGVPVLEQEGYHLHDWEGYQVRLDPDGELLARATSHRGHNHSDGIENWASDAGLGFVNRVAEGAGIRPAGGWGEPSGLLHITPGSQAGSVASRSPAASQAEPDALQLVPLELLLESGAPLPDFDPVTPPWRKRLWRDPEASGTG